MFVCVLLFLLSLLSYSLSWLFIAVVINISIFYDFTTITSLVGNTRISCVFKSKFQKVKENLTHLTSFTAQSRSHTPNSCFTSCPSSQFLAHIQSPNPPLVTPSSIPNPPLLIPSFIPNPPLFIPATSYPLLYSPSYPPLTNPPFLTPNPPQTPQHRGNGTLSLQVPLQHRCSGGRVREAARVPLRT